MQCCVFALLGFVSVISVWNGLEYSAEALLSVAKRWAFSLLAHIPVALQLRTSSGL